MLKITIEVIPFGEESQKTTLHEIYIEQIARSFDSDERTYRTYFDQDPRDDKEDGKEFKHNRTDGAVKCCWKALGFFK